MFKTKSGAVKLQVLITPAEYRELRERARYAGSSISMIARTLLFRNLLIQGTGKYQPRGFARKRRETV